MQESSSSGLASLVASKFPGRGTTIFTVMSQMAARFGAVNLSQGFPDFTVDERLVELTAQAMREGHNQYAPMIGHPLLRQAIAQKLQHCYGLDFDAETEITITSGATEAIFDAVAAVVFPGDEVIVLEPCYDSYIPAIELCGGKAIPVPLGKGFSPDWQQITSAVTSRTKALIINSPHNPTGTVFSAADITELEKLVDYYGLWVISDEVYEHLVFDGTEHQSVLKSEILRARSFAVFSFGKTYHATGWKLGYCVAPPALSTELRKIHQYITFSSFAPAQVALAHYLAEPAHYLELGAFYQERRDFFLSLVSHTPLKWLPSRGSYFVLADYSEVSSLGDRDFSAWLTQQIGVACIPLSPFFSSGHCSEPLVRFCFAKKKETLKLAAERLDKLATMSSK